MKNLESVFVVGLFVGIAFTLGWSLKPMEEMGGVEKTVIVKPSKPEVPQRADVTQVAAALFDEHHEEAVLIFDGLAGFGFERIIPAIRHDFRNPSRDPEALGESIFTDHDFTFIGNDASIRRRKEGVVEQNVAVFEALKKSRSRAVPAEGSDLLALKTFEKDPKAKRDFHVEGDSIFGYGPLRASANCANCHGVEEGTLLGMFRYRFDKPLNINEHSLAALPK